MHFNVYVRFIRNIQSTAIIKERKKIKTKKKVAMVVVAATYNSNNSKYTNNKNSVAMFLQCRKSRLCVCIFCCCCKIKSTVINLRQRIALPIVFSCTCIYLYWHTLLHSYIYIQKNSHLFTQKHIDSIVTMQRISKTELARTHTHTQQRSYEIIEKLSWE